jgi:hypothetical protein
VANQLALTTICLFIRLRRFEISFNWTRAPVHGETGVYSQPVAAEFAAEAAQPRWTCGLHVRNPVFELAGASFADKDHELLRGSSACGQLTASSAQVCKQYPLGVVQVGAAPQQEPAQRLRTGQYSANRGWRL